MKIPTAKYLKNKARIRLEAGQDPKQVVLVYAGIGAALTLVVNLIQYYVSTQMAHAGGLQNIGTRSILETISNVLPILQNVIMMCVGLGYTAAMLRIGRRQFASPKTLKAGVERFWVLLRSRLLMLLLYMGIAFPLCYAAIAIFMLTPLSNSFTAAVMAFVDSSTFSVEAMLNNETLMAQLTTTMIPMMLLYLALLIPCYLVVSYLYRFVDYILIDQPGCGALEAMRKSRALSKGNLFRLFKIDLSFWWYYLLRVLCAVLVYGDVILALFGIRLSFFATLAVFLAADAGITILFQNKLEVTFALAYDSLIPKQQQEGVILGNIFDNPSL